MPAAAHAARAMDIFATPDIHEPFIISKQSMSALAMSPEIPPTM
jgi:hypothetical protein